MHRNKNIKKASGDGQQMGGRKTESRCSEKIKPDWQKATICPVA
jgi:hypothetical protein